MAPIYKATEFNRQSVLKRVNGNKTFMNRINHEKSLPFKKRLFVIELPEDVKPRFTPTPYEKPVTRSQGRRAPGESYANKENQSTSGVSSNRGRKPKVNRKPAESSKGLSAKDESPAVNNGTTQLANAASQRNVIAMGYFGTNSTSEPYQMKFVLPPLINCHFLHL